MGLEAQEQRAMPRLRLHFECGGFSGDIEGEVDDVVRALLLQLAKVFPSLELASKLSFNPDLVELSSSLVGVVEFAPDGLILNAKDLPADEAIVVSLLGMYVGFRLGRVQSDSLPATGLARATGKALKTVSNQLAWMVDEGLVERVGRGEYRVASLGIKRAQAVAAELRERVRV
jgi:hypothetical protein